MNDQKARLQARIVKAADFLKRLRPYSLVIFIGFVCCLYVFLLLRINSLGSQQPSSDQVTSQVQAARIPHIDKAVVKQLESLQDNSVSVRTLFNQARSNPFQ